MLAAATVLGLQVLQVDLRAAGDIVSAFEAAIGWHADALSQREFDPALRRPGLPERRRVATKVTRFLLWPDSHRLVIVSFRTHHPLRHLCRHLVWNSQAEGLGGL
jgi:hypothetical protein